MSEMNEKIEDALDRVITFTPTLMLILFGVFLLAAGIVGVTTIFGVYEPWQSLLLFIAYIPLGICIVCTCILIIIVTIAT